MKNKHKTLNTRMLYLFLLHSNDLINSQTDIYLSNYSIKIKLMFLIFNKFPLLGILK